MNRKSRLQDQRPSKSSGQAPDRHRGLPVNARLCVKSKTKLFSSAKPKLQTCATKHDFRRERGKISVNANTATVDSRQRQHRQHSTKQLIRNDVRAVRQGVIKLLSLIDHLGNRIDEKFLGQPFILSFPPDAPVNCRRFKLYLDELRQLSNLLQETVSLWVIACMTKPSRHWIHLLAEEIKRGPRSLARQPARLRSIYQRGSRK